MLSSRKVVMSNQPPLTLERTRTLAKECVAERGENFVYNSDATCVTGCFYVPLADDRCPPIREGDPLPKTYKDDPKYKTGCLIGEILKRGGYLTDEIASNRHGITDLIVRDLVDVESSTVRMYLSTLQNNQDNGLTWGEALARAENEVS
jgi:hypothetical protein